MKNRKLNIEDIKFDEYYNLSEISLMLGVHHTTLIRRCHSGDMICQNIGTKKRATFRVLGKDLLNYLKK